jgi:hypothetical protein
MILIDANALIILILGMMDKRLINRHKCTSIYEEQDYDDLLFKIGDIRDLVVLPNVWTETDNLLNNFNGGHRYKYIQTITEAIKKTSEVYLASHTAAQSDYFIELGLTDALLLEHSKTCELLITADSALADAARSKQRPGL